MSPFETKQSVALAPCVISCSPSIHEHSPVSLNGDGSLATAYCKREIDLNQIFSEEELVRLIKIFSFLEKEGQVTEKQLHKILLQKSKQYRHWVLLQNYFYLKNGQSQIFSIKELLIGSAQLCEEKLTIICDSCKYSTIYLLGDIIKQTPIES